LEYNTARPDLQLPEYGRNVKKMVNFALTVEDKEERQKVVAAIIQVMGQLNPHLRDVDDYNHKLWDHIFIMSDFKLDVESPYPIPTKETFETKPNSVSYPKGNIRYGHYGESIQDLIDAIPAKTDPEERKALTQCVANLMKRFYLTWNRDSVEDQTILNQMNEISGGKLELKLEDLALKNSSELQVKGVRPTEAQSNRPAKKGGRFQKNHRKKRN
jgi:hypothetical protein